MYKYLIGLFWLFACNSFTYAQSIVVKPYLQDLTQNSVKILFETSSTTNATIFFGQDSFHLNQQVASSFQTGNGSSRIHTAFIQNLNSGSEYYYRAQLENGVSSSIYKFITLKPVSAKQNINLILISDTQHQSNRPDILRNMVTDGIIPVINQEIQGGIDSIHGLIVAGDLVTTGSTYSQWKTYFFDHLEPIIPYVPIYPALGNHDYWTGEQGLPNYLKYFDLPLNGSTNYLEQWWHKDISNIKLITLDSQTGTPGKNLQLAWLQSVLNNTCTNADIDFILLQLHHPYKSELWTPGELAFAGQVIDLLDNFVLNCNKQAVHVFGHTHGYSRGQSKERQHIWMNVATGGGAIDYWGEWPQYDYEEFVHSEDDYGFVLAQITTGEDASFRLRRFSMGDDINPLAGIAVDEIALRKTDMPPSKPKAVFPFGVVPFQCVTLKASQFDEPFDFHQATQWQISLSPYFNAPIADIWKQHKNVYFNQDLQQGEDLTEIIVTSLQPNTQYYWRVRFRDQHLNWSNWSDTAQFITNLGTVTPNLLTNPGAEDGTLGWNGNIESLTSNQCNSVPVYQGMRFFAVGGVCANEQTIGIADQWINLSGYIPEIENGLVVAQFSGYLRNFGVNSDLPEFYLEFYNISGGIVGVTPKLSNNQPQWLFLSGNFQIPSGARRLRFVLMGTRLSGSDNDSYFDDLSLKLILSEPCLSCFGFSGVDQDGDGFCSDLDCNDMNPLIFPGAKELCDGLDNNCDGNTDSGQTVHWTGAASDLKWENPSNWSQLFLPLRCQHVIISGDNTELDSWQMINSLEISEQSNLLIKNNATLDVFNLSVDKPGILIEGDMINEGLLRILQSPSPDMHVKGNLHNNGKLVVKN